MPKRAFLVLVLIGSLLSLIWLTSSQSTPSTSLTKAHPSPTSSIPSKEAVSAKLTTLERGWVKNEGQWDQRALFSAPGYFGTTWITKDGELLHVVVKKEKCKEKACPSKSWVISERWVGGKVQTIKGEEELQTKVSYFIGNDPSKHRSNLPTYRYVSLGEVWSGVEVKLKATQKTVEKLFYIKPGADPSKIVVQVDGAEGLKLSKDGEIIIKTGLGELKLSKPIAWQEKDGKKLPVEVSYKLIGKNRYSFEVAKADPSLPIVIDPILQSTYLGGSNNNEVYALAVHPTTGEVYVAGLTESIDFPNTSGGAQERKSGGDEAFVVRLDKDLTQILQATYLGGSRWDEARALAIHPTTGEVYVAGYTESANFPKATGGAQKRYGGKGDTFVARLDKDLTKILQSTYLGGKGLDVAYALAIHPTTGEVYVAGLTESANFPKATGGAQTNCNNCNGRLFSYDVFVARLNSNLTQILQSTYLGGKDSDVAYALAIHPTTGEVYVAGLTESIDFPNTSGGAQEVHGGGKWDAFVARLNSNLTQILQSTYLGGKRLDAVFALAVHPKTGDVYVAGYTLSTNFPKTAGGAQTGHRGGSEDAFVARLNKDLTKILQSTYLGGNNSDIAHALAIHPTTGEVYVAGETESTNFPGVARGAQKSKGKKGDAFVARLNSNLTKILRSTYLGGSGYDYATALAISSTGDVYVAGHTLSEDFPKATGGAQATFEGRGFNAFVSRLTADLAAGRSSGVGSSITAYASSTAGF
jgi:FOG: PKD repeat